MRKRTGQQFNWAGLRLIATIALLLCQVLTLRNEYLQQENKVLRSRIGRRVRFTDHERRSLVKRNA